MLAIRPEQFVRLEGAMRERLPERIAAFLRREQPGACEGLTNEILEKRATIGIRRAGRYGIATEGGLTAFVALMFLSAPNFDEQPHIQSLLRDAEVPPHLRLRLLGECTVQADWDEVEAHANNAVWNAAQPA